MRLCGRPRETEMERSESPRDISAGQRANAINVNCLFVGRNVVVDRRFY